ncbi:MAG: DUF2905 domain-containing protein [Leptospirillum sp.]|nr:DUF2905 domain-containing protein [Nitrospiraceae bacterium]
MLLGGLFFVLAGLSELWSRWGRKSGLPLPGRLPGDIEVHRPGFHLYFPLMTSLLLSVGISLLLFLFSWISRKF